ncbi:MAG: hypothetical protein A2Z24_02345 [Candidatus Woykebacteria bacterium RBG_16_44_10]|uniref:Leucine--tRNA ligase n=1 Tax=Candidatus Woykebacteria bacterium RBG_16_44_10 TaxID=1802597 RepID=A0A1G1WDX9_9BACT|nr:MAG: hypothetical protein A2Z24_02345 [Candidatus Woykebacteria bacterium RBG_16_44_10]
MIDRYNPSEIEKKWRDRWEQEKTFRVDLTKAKKPFYNLMMFPYPSGEGLHVGHVYAFGGSDTYGRFMRLQGYDVFEPMGFDSFGIHSENYAIKVGTHPKKLISETTNYFRESQLKRLGALFDWDHQVITSEADYYKWTQWIFVQLFKAGLALRKKAPVDWCPSCKTVLANEQVINSRCERCNTQVIQKELEQWFFKITDYAEKLLKNLDVIDWSETTKAMQRNWIGRSEGTTIEFRIQNSELKIPVFTTRPDTIFGATFMVLAPEHPLSLKISSAKYHEAISKYIEESKKASEIERQSAKTGVFTGAYCINPLTKQEIPIWVADYVLMGYGTGAIMAVPAHDARDYEFAKTHKLKIVEVISGGEVSKEAYVGEGKLVNSGEFNGLDSKTAIEKISKYIEDNKIGTRTVNYHLRDWLISRQRYWGPPIPMIYCEACAKQGKSWFTSQEAENFQFEIFNLKSNEEKFKNLKIKIKNSAHKMRGWYPVPEEELPVELPHLDNYQPKGKGVSPLATLPDFVRVKCPGCGKNGKRETDVSDTFLDSSWYFLRYPSVGVENAEVARQQFGSVSNPRDEAINQGPNASSLVPMTPHKLVGPPASRLPWDPEVTKKWLPVDMYIGGNEHAVMHLLYTRFITMALKDIGLINFEEPFKKFRAHGLIIREGAKMSKSRGNVVNPNDYMDAYGADTLRMYLLFIGPYDQGGDFSDRAIAGIHRFLNRVWQNTLEIIKSPDQSAKSDVAKEINKLIKKVGEDAQALKFNTAIAATMEFNNFAANRKKEVDITTLKKYLIVLSIFAPFLAEELWSRTGEKSSVHDQKWPLVEEAHLREDEMTIAAQINGKLRSTFKVPTVNIENQKEIEDLAFASDNLKKYLVGKKVKKVVYVPGKVINIVT